MQFFSLIFNSLQFKKNRMHEIEDIVNINNLIKNTISSWEKNFINGIIINELRGTLYDIVELKKPSFK